jgi:hypothetical protein
MRTMGMTGFASIRPRIWSGMVAGIALVGALAGPSAAYADDTRQAARDLGTNPVQVKVNDTVGQADIFDYFRFQLAETRAVNVELFGLTTQTQLYLLGPNGEVIAGKQGFSGGGTAIREDLAAGTYFLLVNANAGQGSYELRLGTFIPYSGSRTEDLGALDGMGGLNNTKIANGNVGPDRSVDFWFTLPDTREVRVDARIATGGALFDANSRVLSVLQNGQLARTLEGGRYFVRLFPNQQQTIPYRLLIQAQAPNTNDTAGNLPALARHLGVVGNPPVAVDEFVGRFDFDDYYRVSVPPGSMLNFQLTQRGENANVWIYNAAGVELAQFTNPGPANEMGSVDAPNGGDFLIRVGIATRRAYPNGFWENSNYRLLVGSLPVRGQLSPAPKPVPPPSADSRGLPMPLRPNAAYGDTVGATDPVDWWEVLWTPAPGVNYRNITLSLAGQSDGLVLTLYRQISPNAPLEFVARSSTPGTSETIRTTFDAYDPGGNRYQYLVTVTGSSGPIAYTLTLSDS